MPELPGSRGNSKMKKKKKLIRSKPKDNEDPIKAKLIKIYPFNINELSEENTRDWF